MRGQQPFAFAAPERRNFFRHDIQPIRVEHHGLLHFFNELENLGGARFARPGPTAQTSIFSFSN